MRSRAVGGTSCCEADRVQGAHDCGRGARRQLLTSDPRVLELADGLVDVTFTLHQSLDQTDRDQRSTLARTAHNAFIRAVGPLVRA